MHRLSLPIEQMKEHYDVVVVGSGYGGGISASRMARAGRSVCLMERGKEKLPGEYPDTEAEAIGNMQLNTPDGHVGSKTGMFEFHVNEYMNALVGCGLGGTSLINANVALRTDPGVFEDERWPEVLRGKGLEVLKPYYDRAEEMLQPSPFPQDREPVDKFAANKKSAEAMGMGDQFYAPPINVHFEDGVNAAGVEQKACTLCGDCVSGCNHYAKNTTLMNYVPDAWNHGAEIFTEVSVKYVERRDDGKWIVFFQPVDEGRQKFNAPDLFVTCDIVILAAGTLGSSEIMLRSREKGLPTSELLGQRFSGNGDVLGFGYNCDEKINGIGFGNRPPGEVPNVGPCITSIIDLRENQEDTMKGYVVEEGSIPGAIGGLMPAAFGAAADLIGEDTDTGFVDRLKEKGRCLDSMIRGPYHGAVQNTQTYLIMSHDGADGTLTLEDDRVRIDWPQVGDESVFDRDNETLLNATKALGGTYVKNPIWTDLFKNSLITVHPLGGCCMGDDAGKGVVNDRGQVYSGTSGTDVHEGLYVADGAIVPMSLAVNPLFTISALAERINAIIAEENGWTIDYTVSKALKPGDPPPKMGIEFTETMKGFFSTEVKDDYQDAYDQGKGAGSSMEFTLTIASDDVNAMIREPAHKASIVGTLSCRALSAEALTVNGGEFNLFVENPDEVDTRNMVYRMSVRSEEGKDYYFHGFKTVTDSCVIELWPQTTTLYVTVYEGDNDQGDVVGKGILHIHPLDFAKQMTTMEVTNAPSITEKLKALAEFGKFFAGVLWESYGGVLVPDTFFNPDAPPRRKRQLRVGPPEVHTFETSDGKVLRLTRYRGGKKGPLLMVHGAGVSSAIFSTDLIDTNMLEYLYAHGYDCWLFDFRVSIALPAAKEQSNGDQCASIDHPEAVQYVLKATGAESLQAMVHCYGSTTFFMSMLAGLQGVRSMVCSQIASDIIVPKLTGIKAGLHLPSVLDTLGVDSLTAYADSQEGLAERLYDAALKVYPVPGDERCRSAVCHRITFMYGLLYEHQQLTQRFHDNLHELFAELNIETFEHLALMVRKGHLVSFDDKDIYMPHLDRLKLPILFVHGEKNECYLPDSTKVTYDKLGQLNGPDYYTRKVIPGYGHIDCIFGKNAAADVYPLIVEHLDKTNT